MPMPWKNNRFRLDGPIVWTEAAYRPRTCGITSGVSAACSTVCVEAREESDKLYKNNMFLATQYQIRSKCCVTEVTGKLNSSVSRHMGVRYAKRRSMRPKFRRPRPEIRELQDIKDQMHRYHLLDLSIKGHETSSVTSRFNSHYIIFEQKTWANPNKRHTFYDADVTALLTCLHNYIACVICYEIIIL